MKKTLLISLAFAATTGFVACSGPEKEEQQDKVINTEIEDEPDTLAAQPDTLKGSIPSEAVGSIGGANLKITYHSPGVKNRVIWGGLVPYGQVWVTGAHMATSFETDKALLIDGKEIPAGKYALFTIPKQGDWTFIINKNWEQHLADKYDEKDDVLRMKVDSEKLKQHQERLKYEIVQKSDAEGAIKVSWEKRGITVPFKVK